MSRWDVLGLGVITVDDLIYVDRFPEPDTKVRTRAERRQGGGLTATALVAAARLGAKAAYLGILGNDELSHYAVEELAREGVDCSSVEYRTGARPIHATVIVDASTGGRTILYSMDGVFYPEPDDINGDLITASRALVVDQRAGASAVRAVELAQARGIPVVADVEATGDAAGEELLCRADHLIIGIELGRRATGFDDPPAVVAALASPARACCAVTAGAQGCWYSERGDTVRHVPALLVAAVDTTGCGDVFHGAYATSIVRGEGVDTAIRVATTAAGLKATQPGGRAGIPDRATVDRFLAGMMKDV
jgi:sulfofructose kinase